LITGLILTYKIKNKKYLLITVGIIIGIIVLNYSLGNTVSKFTQMDKPINTNYSNAYNTGVYTVRPFLQSISSLNNTVYINNAYNLNSGDILGFGNGTNIQETNIVSSIQYSTDGSNTPILILLNPLKNNYPTGTMVFKVSDSTPNIISPPDPNVSIQKAGAGYISDPYQMATQNYPPFKLPNQDRNDWNLELSTMVPGSPNYYQYQGQPNGPLKCREGDISNPMGTINVTEYDQAPTMFGTCNVMENNNNNKYTTAQEATVSQRVNDLLFHKGNAQAQFSPVPIDTIPNDQEAFAHWCYRNPTNLVNPKYASVFVNDPDKFKLVSKLARATGTENGGGGGGH
jgi:hypothetical protein